MQAMQTMMKPKKQILKVRSGIACKAKEGICFRFDSEGINKTEWRSNFLYLSEILVRNSFKPETYIKTNVEAPSSSTIAMSSILTIISGPAISITMITANVCQIPLDIVLFSQSNTKLSLCS